MANLKLIGSRFTKIIAERKPEFSGKLEMKTNIKINSIEKVKDSKDTVKTTYTFEIDYTELGKVSIEGSLFLSGDSKSIKEILKIRKGFCRYGKI